MNPPTVFLIVVLAVIFARRGWPFWGGQAPGRSDASLRAELDELRARVHELESTPPRVAELEERVDFAERLLARRGEHGQVGGMAQ